MATLTDTGPLVSLIDEADTKHNECVDVLSEVSIPLVTTWPCFTEAMYLLGSRTGWNGQHTLWKMVGDEVLALHVVSNEETERMKALMEKYRDTPMDLADASLVATAETIQLRRIFTLDSDFHVYRVNDIDAFEVIP